MAITDYHAQVLAYQLTNRSASTDIDKLAGTLASAQVHLNPHQIDAALFAFQSPLSQGVLLADEVGLKRVARVHFNAKGREVNGLGASVFVAKGGHHSDCRDVPWCGYPFLADWETSEI